MPLSEIDLAQTTAQIVGLKAQRDALLTANPTSDVSALQAEIDKLEALINPPVEELTPPVDFLPESSVYDKRTGKRWPKFYYCGGWFVAPPKDHPIWRYFVATFGEAMANDPSNWLPIEGQDSD